MLQTRNKFSAIINCKCPRCRKGDMFTYSILRVTSFSKMNKTCPRCGLYYEIEPGFFYGAMYFSYALNVAQLAIVGIITFRILGDPSATALLISMISTILLLTPVNYRLARSLMLHFLGSVKYQKDW